MTILLLLLIIIIHHLPINKKNRKQQQIMMKILQIDENYLPHDMINEVIADIVRDQKKTKQIGKQLNHPMPKKIQFIKIKQIMTKILLQAFFLLLINPLNQSIDFF